MDKGTHEFTDNALVDKDGNGDAKDANKGEVAASPTEIEFQILSGSAPILYEFVLVCFHSSSHLLLFFFLSLSLFSSSFSDPIPLSLLPLSSSPLPNLPLFLSMGLGPLLHYLILHAQNIHAISSYTSIYLLLHFHKCKKFSLYL